MITLTRLAALIQTCSDQYEKLLAEGKVDLKKGTFAKYAAIAIGTVLNIEARERGEGPLVNFDRVD